MIARYVTMFVVAAVSFTVAFFALGADRAFEPGAWDVSALWVALSFVLGLVAAVAGGLV